MDGPLTTGLTWLGTRTNKYSETVAFFKEGLGLMPLVERPHFAAFDLPDGSIIEVFGPSDRDHVHFGSAPVAGLLVLDIEAATRRIEAAGGMFLAYVWGWPEDSGRPGLSDANPFQVRCHCHRFLPRRQGGQRLRRTAAAQGHGHVLAAVNRIA
jgi:hypothetical protein